MHRATVSTLPMPWTRLILSGLTLVWSIVAGALCVQVFIQGNKRSKFIRSHAPAGVEISVNTNDITHLNIGVFIASSLLSSASSNPLMFLLQDMFHVIPPSAALPWGLRLPTDRISTRTLRMQAITMLVTSVAVVGATIPFTITARQKEAMVVATMGNIKLPDSFVLQLEASLGVTRIYWHTMYIRVVVFVAWISVLFAIPMTAVTVVAWLRGSPREDVTSLSRSSPDPEPEKSKDQLEFA
ncbi:hypothetical protein BD410DRAFT_90935 [Rickenella mellea]|uniref:Uncharacterized protein n=1 Tax=Rickenella mellea TaxID=50990 RepID=A0A4Y7QA07_9AGAM|nr:hypothetical protein BD410DRAFT_90935 [Rickenella mellea]